MQLVRIVTHHKWRQPAAELFSRENVAAMGWAVVGDLRGQTSEQIELTLRRERLYGRDKAVNARSQLLALRDKVRKRNIVFAYQCDNIVALVGTVTDEYEFNDTNELGNPGGQFKYPQQIKVAWRDKPRAFPRSYLPGLSDWLARRGTIAFHNYDGESLEKALRKIP